MSDWKSELNEMLGIDPDDPQQRLATYLAGQSSDLIHALAQERRRQGLSVDDMAKRLGVPHQAVPDFERLGGDPRLSSIRRYALALGMKVTHVVETFEPSKNEVD